MNPYTTLFITVRGHQRNPWAHPAGGLVCQPDPRILRYVHTCAGGRRRRRADNWLQHKSLHVFTHARSRSGDGAGAKTSPQEMGPTPNLPGPLRNRVLQTIIVLKKWQIRPHPLRVCVNIPAVTEREYQNLPAFAQQPLRACVNIALAGTALLNGFQSPWGVWNPLSKKVPSKCSFILNKGPVNIWNNHKAQD